MPRGSMLKFFRERGGDQSEHGGDLHWPGTADGYPFRGPAPDLKQDEYFDVPLALDYHSGVFKLWQRDGKDGKLAFDEVMDRIVNGWYMQHKRIDRWDEEKNGLVVWLEWVQIYGETPHSKNPGISQGGRYEAQPGRASPASAGVYQQQLRQISD